MTASLLLAFTTTAWVKLAKQTLRRGHLQMLQSNTLPSYLGAMRNILRQVILEWPGVSAKSRSLIIGQVMQLIDSYGRHNDSHGVVMDVVTEALALPEPEIKI